MAIKEGLIGAVDDPITRYLPELKGSAWENVPCAIFYSIPRA